MTRRVVYVAYGEAAISEAQKSIVSLREHNQTEVSIICNENTKWSGAQGVSFGNPGAGARWAKLNIDLLVDDDIICYLDADTRVRGDLSPAFEIIENGFDLAIATSVNQGYNVFSHVGVDEREATLLDIGNSYPLQLQAGVMFFHRERCRKLFAEWRKQWQRWQDQDQAALIRALYVEPVRVWLLGQCWNSDTGAVISHLFGRARQ